MMSEGWVILFEKRMNDWKIEADNNEIKIMKYKRKLEKYEKLKQRCIDNYNKMKKQLESRLKE